jgi:hypothetical protein
VAPACNPSYSGGRDPEDHGWRPAQTNSETPPQSGKAGNSGARLSSLPARSINRRIVVEAGLGINARPYLKIN